MTGLTVYHTAVVANGTLIFHNNTGIDGGGLAMYGNSYVMFHQDSALNFTNNSAKEKGGAIFVDTQLKFAPCFFQYSDNTLPQSVKVTISGNTAGIQQALSCLVVTLAGVFYFLQIKLLGANALTKHLTIQHRLVPQ